MADRKVLECSSRCDKRFSAFYAKVEVFGKCASIETHYQLSKVFLAKAKPVSLDDPGNTDSQYIQFGSVKDVKAFQKEGNAPKELRINNVGYPVEYLTQWYKLLWVKYLDKYPELVRYAAQFDDYSDMFRGAAVNCQADVIRQYVMDGRQSIIQECQGLISLMNQNGKTTGQPEDMEDAEWHKCFEQLEIWTSALNQAAASGSKKGEFVCPICGGRAWYETYPHPWPWDRHATATRGGCENRCIAMMS